MGQQQLLLLVLGILIVGLAVVGGIEAFQQGRTDVVSDQARASAMSLGADALAFYTKSRELGGAGGNLTLEDSERWRRKFDLETHPHFSDMELLDFTARNCHGLMLQVTLKNTEVEGLTGDRSPTRRVTIPFRGDITMHETEFQAQSDICD